VGVAARPPAGPPTGLASLDVELPGPDAARWESHRFTTPRGEIELTAYAAAGLAIGGLKRIGLAAAALALVVGLRWISTRGLGTTGRRVLSTVMILLGVLGLMIGIFPIAGLVMIIAGIWCRHSGRFK
jgi:hypothetical protein